MHDAKQRANAPVEDGPSGHRAEDLREPELMEVEKSATAPSAEWIKLQALALQQLDRFIGLEPKVLRGEDPEAIHDMRVASRRLQQVLDLIYPPPAPREVRRLRRRVRRCRRVLGEVRNCDVLLERVEKSLARNRNSQHAIWEAARDYLGARRSESFDKALRKLGKTNVAALYVGLKEHLAVNGAGGPGTWDSESGVPTGLAHRRQKVDGIRQKAVVSRQGAQNLKWEMADGKLSKREARIPNPEPRTSASFYERVGHSLESAWTDFVDKVGKSHRQPEASTLHGVRIATKRLRYLVEVVDEFEVPGSGESLAWLRGLQQHLGDWHDLEVMEGMLTEMLARPKFIRGHLDMASDVLRLIRRNRRRKKAFEEKYLQVTRHSAEYERTKQWATAQVTGYRLQVTGN